MIEKLKSLLKSLLNKDIEGDDVILNILYNNNRQYVLNNTNLTEIPDGLEYVVEELTIGAYLTYSMNDLLADVDVQPVKSIREGDVQVDFSEGNTKEKILTNMANHYSRSREGDLACYRIIKW